MILDKWCRSEPPKKSFRRFLKRGTPDLSFQMQSITNFRKPSVEEVSTDFDCLAFHAKNTEKLVILVFFWVLARFSGGNSQISVGKY